MKKGLSSTLVIHYGVHASPFGKYLLALERGEVRALLFLVKGGEKEALRLVVRDSPEATLVRDEVRTGKVAQKLFAPTRRAVTLPLVLKGTDFEIKVWDALLATREGETVTYGDIAERIGAARATRAVGTACGKNMIGYLIPCHRVVPKAGGLGNYRWGRKNKEALLAWECSRG
jgi:AraC family transcriptional regulator of adaptative response/methylated-DNA-[protein]-cysteine methyltransferase